MSRVGCLLVVSCWALPAQEGNPEPIVIGDAGSRQNTMAMNPHHDQRAVTAFVFTDRIPARFRTSQRRLGGDARPWRLAGTARVTVFVDWARSKRPRIEPGSA
jgi:hypothetical protein